MLAAAKLLSDKKRLTTFVTGALTTGALAQFVYVKLRWIEAARPPRSNMYESMPVMVWTMVIVYLFVEWRYRIPMLGLASLRFYFAGFAAVKFTHGGVNYVLSGLHSYAQS